MPTFRQHLFGLVLVAQPLPGLAATLSVGAFALIASAASHQTPEAGRLLELLVSIECTQIAIGAVNDYCDRTLDAASDRLKPIPRGWIQSSEALLMALLATIIMLTVAIPLGGLAFSLIVFVEVLGLSYDLWFKGTIVSGLLYALGFPLSPLLGWSVFGHWQPFLGWMIPLGAVLGIAMNISNSLPDLESDIAGGRRGLPHVLGFRRGLYMVWGILFGVSATLCLLSLTGLVSAHPKWLAVASVSGILVSTITIVLYQLRPTPSTLRLNFFIHALGMTIMGVAWLVSVAF